MFQNYLKIAWRNLIRNRIISFINLAGLSFSVAFCLLLYFYIRYEQSYDSFHEKKDRLFRLEMTNYFSPQAEQPKKDLFAFLKKNNGPENDLLFPLVVAGNMENTFPEIKSITRFEDLSNHYGDQLVKTGTQVFKESHVLYADNNFFSNFSFRLITGDPHASLNGMDNIVLSETTAKKYFGSEDPMGKTIALVHDSNRLFRVSGVAEDAPANSSIRYSLILPIMADPAYAENIKEKFNQNDHVYIIELADGVSAQKFQSRMNEWVKNYYAEVIKGFQAGQESFHWYLRPLADCHYIPSYEWGHFTDEKSIYELSSLVLVILIIASLNYVLLAISNAAARSPEVGVRKVMGAHRGSIILQFWIETQILVLIAVITGILLAGLFLPLFNSVMNTPIRLAAMPLWDVLTASVGLCVLVGILAGYYPALFISRLRPAAIIKSFQTFRINPKFSKVLVVIQYTACVTLMVAALVISRQMKYVATKDLGFDKAQIVLVRNPINDPVLARRVQERMEDFAKSEPSIFQYSSMNGNLDGGGNRSGFMFHGERKEFTRLSVGYNYFEMLKIPVLQGRSFSPQFSGDTAKAFRAVVVNETLFNLLGGEAKLGVFNKDIEATIIGVVKDYHFASLAKKIEPEMHTLLANRFSGQLMFKIRAGQMQDAIEKLASSWKGFTNNYPFEYTFLDQTIEKMYAADLVWQKTIQASCFFAIFIACMGLFGLSAINAVNRTREIGIRKVLGASISDVVSALSKSFLFMILLSILIATPIAWWVMSNWLQDFAYRIHISWWMFALVGVSAFGIALVTVSIQAVKAALANPVDSLRME